MGLGSVKKIRDTGFVNGVFFVLKYFQKIKLKRDKVAVDLTVHEGGDASDPDETDKHLRNKLALFQALEYPLRLV